MAEDTAAPEGEANERPTGGTGAARSRISPEVATLAVGLIGAIVLTVVVGWLGFRTQQGRDVEAHRDLIVAVARQEAANITTIDYQHPEDDVQRVLDLATGSFYASFARRSHDLIDTVKREESKAVGTATEAALSSEAGNQAQVLVAVSVRSKHLGGLDKPPQGLRMRMLVEKAGKQMKVADVELVR
ncbi:Mce protein [Mycobacterium talmoniae]|uniref:Mce protein n=1 Tax=Mycobacterium talmoniae TaxID=1858794 RepID=A0A2S8BQ83_9MYCO|nr:MULTISPECIES: Mce protein [Mycobacterium]PQM48797.1 hypothetical protein C1Y40_00994 [Mycobacterium talmoniae]